MTSSSTTPAKPPATYTHGHAPSVLLSHSRRTAQNSAAYLLPHLKPSSHILDLGCGPGTITVSLAQLVPDGHVTGVDFAASVLETARANAKEKGVGNVTFEAADAMSLPYKDGTFDVVHAHQVLQHLSDPVGALREMRRVCKPGGVVAARDADYKGMCWFPETEGLAAWGRIYQSVARASGGEPDAGRRILAWALEAGPWGRVVGAGSSWVFCGEEDRAWWGGMWAERTVASSFGEKAVQGGFATRKELEEISDAWKDWAGREEAWFGMVHGEVLCWV